MNFLEATSWVWGERPSFLGPLHIVYLILSPTLVILFAWLLRKSSERQNKIILVSCGVFLILTEIYKHLFYFYIVHNGESYPMWIFPWQLCSIPMYFLPFAPFIKNRTIQSTFYNFLFAFSGLGGIMMHFEPSGAFNIDHIALTMHSLIWHSTLLFVMFYLAMSNRAARSKRDYLLGLGLFFITASIAELLNGIVFVNMGPVMNMYFISPFTRTSIAVFSNIYDALGEAVGRFVVPLIYTFALSLGGFLIHVITYYIRKGNAHSKIRKYERYRKTSLDHV